MVQLLPVTCELLDLISSTTNNSFEGLEIQFSGRVLMEAAQCPRFVSVTHPNLKAMN